MKINESAVADIGIALRADDKFILSRVLDSHPEFASADYQAALAPYMKEAAKNNPELCKMLIEAGVSAELAGEENSTKIAKMFDGKFPSQKSIQKNADARLADLEMAARNNDEIIASRMLDLAPYLSNPEFSDRMDRIALNAVKQGNEKFVVMLADLGVNGSTLSDAELSTLAGNPTSMKLAGTLLGNREVNVASLQSKPETVAATPTESPFRRFGASAVPFAMTGEPTKQPDAPLSEQISKIGSHVGDAIGSGADSVKELGKDVVSGAGKGLQMFGQGIQELSAGVQNMFGDKDSKQTVAAVVAQETSDPMGDFLKKLEAKKEQQGNEIQPVAPRRFGQP